MKFLAEISEILLQSNALLIYNGYDIFDPNREHHVYQANKPEFISVFASIIAFNCFGSGLLWLLYALLPYKCYGLVYKRCIFFIDKFSDFFYIIFPFLMLYYDDYNSNVYIYVLMAQLNMESGFAFFAVYFPLFFACTKCLMISIVSTYRLRKLYFEEWKEKYEWNQKFYAPRTPSSPPDIETLDVVKSRSASFASDYADEIPSKEASPSPITPKQPSISTSTNATREWDQSWIRKSTDISKFQRFDNRTIYTMKTIIISILSLTLISYGIFIVVYVSQHLRNAKNVCGSVTESNFFMSGILNNDTLTIEQTELLQNNPELFLWDKCV